MVLTHTDVYYAFFNTRVLRDALLRQPWVPGVDKYLTVARDCR